MQSTLNRLRLGFLSVFALAILGIWGYQIGWVQPRDRCEAAHRWWSDEDRKCAIPVSISVFTGRPSPGEPAGALVRSGPTPAQ